MSNMIARAEIVARIAHGDQVDKTGVPYTEHLRAVADISAQLSPWPTFDPWYVDLIVTAWLNDSIVDTPLSLHDLRELGFSNIAVDAVNLMTVYEGMETHDENLVRIREAGGIAGIIAKVVRRADIKHNNDPSRNPSYMTAEKLAEREARKLAILSGTA